MPNSGKLKSAVNRPTIPPGQLKRGLLLLILAGLSYLVPKKRGLYIFGNSYGRGFGGNTRALFLKVAGAVWVTQDKQVYESLKSAGYLVSFFSSWLVLRAEFIFVNDCSYHVTFSPYLIGRFKIIQLWHGTPIKKILFDLPQHQSKTLKNRLLELMTRNFHLVVCNHPEGVQAFKNSFRNSRVELLGCPRNDFLYNLTPPASLCEMLTGKQILLYCPTFRDSGDSPKLTTNLLQQLDDFCAQNNALFLVKRHPHDSTKANFDGFRNIKDITTSVGEVNEILPFVHLLISDYSSIIFDYVNTNRPFILYCPDYQDYLTNNRQLYYDYFQELLGPYAKSESELLELIRTVASWSLQPTYKTSYSKFKTRFNHFHDCGSSERIVKRLKLTES